MNQVAKLCKVLRMLGVREKSGGLIPGIPPLLFTVPLGPQTGLLPLPMSRVPSICRAGADASPHATLGSVVTACPLDPGLASTTMRNWPPLPEKIWGVGPGT